MKKVTTAVLLTLGISTALLACPGGGKKFGGESRDGMKQVMKQLDLSAEQKGQLKNLRETRKEMMQAKKEHRRNMRQEMKPDMSKFMTANSFDKEAFKKEMQKKFEAKRAMREQRQASMMEVRADHMEKMFNILTPEQRKKWIELSQQQKNRKGKNCRS
jgi:protein CpxP